jgi:hypothetical protein
MEGITGSFEKIADVFHQNGFSVRHRSNLDGFSGYPVERMVEKVSGNTLKYPEHILRQLKDLDTVMRNTWSRTRTKQMPDILPILDYRTDAMRDDIICLEKIR